MKKGDIFICVTVLLVALLLLFSTRSIILGDRVEIYVNGNLYGTYNLSENTTLTISTKYGTNTIQIQDQAVWVSESSCKDKLEISAGKIQKQGQSLICLPNRLVISIAGREDVDSVSY